MNKQSTNKKNDAMVFFHNPGDAIVQTISIVSRFLGDFEKDLFVNAVEDVKLLFKGRYSGYRASNTQYHDFEHTVSVTLATARLLHGCYLENLRRGGIYKKLSILFQRQKVFIEPSLFNR